LEWLDQISRSILITIQNLMIMDAEERLKKLEADMQNVIAAKDKEIEELKKQLEEAKKQPEDDADDEYAEELVEKLSAK
jgi:hypothetical protein